MTERELVFCASSTRCTTARLVAKGAIFYCREHRLEQDMVSDPVRAGDEVVAKDRRNRGTVVAVTGSTATVRFDNAAAEVVLALAWLERVPDSPARDRVGAVSVPSDQI